MQAQTTAQTHITYASNAIANKDIEKTIYHYKVASELAGNSSGILLLTIAQLCAHTDDIQEAIKYFQLCLALDSNNSEALFGYAKCLVKKNKLSESINLIEKARSINPTEPSYKSELLKLYLLANRMENAEKIMPVNLWWHNKNIAGQSFFLDLSKAGNGFGDIFLYVRYAKILKDAGAYVTVKIIPPLKPLLSLCPYIDNLIDYTPNISKFNNHYDICVGSLMIRTFEDNSCITPHNYLYADDELIRLWRNKINPKTFNIGLCWEASPCIDLFTKKWNPNHRTIDAKQLVPLNELKGIHFYCLQKHFEYKPNLNITYFKDDFDESHGAFMDTAALMKNLDLVITVDTSIAHLAGALGVPVWLMLTLDNDYRWLADKSDTPWYPSMRLFKQNEYGNWTSVVTEIKNNLTNLLMLEL
jgi:tetratricopeptide (TPR) repeat protein